MVGRIIHSQACIAEGTDWLSQNEPRFALALQQTGPPPLRLRPDGFAPLLNAIVSQQISVAAAASVWTRMEEAKLIRPRALARAGEEQLRECGLSRPKIRYAKALAQSGLKFKDLRSLPDEEVIARLIEIKGIGRWTAEIYAMFSLGRADVFARGDLALQEAARVLFVLPARPGEKEFAQMAIAWSPWRSVAARVLWAYYRVMKNREGIGT